VEQKEGSTLEVDPQDSQNEEEWTFTVQNRAATVVERMSAEAE